LLKKEFRSQKPESRIKKKISHKVRKGRNKRILKPEVKIRNKSFYFAIVMYETYRENSTPVRPNNNYEMIWLSEWGKRFQPYRFRLIFSCGIGENSIVYQKKVSEKMWMQEGNFKRF